MSNSSSSGNSSSSSRLVGGRVRTLCWLSVVLLIAGSTVHAQQGQEDYPSYDEYADYGSQEDSLYADYAARQQGKDQGYVLNAYEV